MAQDRDKWLAFVNTATSLRIPQNSGLSEQMSNHWVLKLTLFYEVNYLLFTFYKRKKETDS